MHLFLFRFEGGGMEKKDFRLFFRVPRSLWLHETTKNEERVMHQKSLRQCGIRNISAGPGLLLDATGGRWAPGYKICLPPNATGCISLECPRRFLPISSIFSFTKQLNILFKSSEHKNKERAVLRNSKNKKFRNC